jgi:hypothetical protein
MLVTTFLEADRAEMDVVEPSDVVGQAALLWRLVYRAVGRMRSERPEFIVVRQATWPAIRLVSSSGSTDSRSRINGPWSGFTPSSSADNPKEPSCPAQRQVDSRASTRMWLKRLEPAEIERVRTLTAGVSEDYYSVAEWNPDT